MARKIVRKNSRNTTVFGKNLKYLFVLLALATLVYTSPAMLDAISSGIAMENQQASVWSSIMNFGRQDMRQAQPQVLRNQRPNNPTDFQRPAYSSEDVVGSSTRVMPPPMMDRGEDNRGDNNRGEGLKDHLLGPQEVITVLFKAGIISEDQLSKALALFPLPRLEGSSTPPVNGRPLISKPLPVKSDVETVQYIDSDTSTQ